MSSEKNPDTRQRILQSTWKLLEEGRGGEVRMSDIAKAVGISRQALYLHFPKRADLLIATTRHIDEVKNVDAMLVESRAAKGGIERLDAFVVAWGSYIPEIFGVAKALISMQDHDEAARLAWADRLQAVRHGCAAAVEALARDGTLLPSLTNEKATDLLWTLLSVENWEHLTRTCGWGQDEYVAAMKALARGALTAQRA
jgi:AcrR family transcriptional regulator